MPSKKKKYNARFPAGRIKKIMQTDEEVGKVAQAVPVIISRTLELFVESLLTKTMQITSAKNAKTLSPSHMKQCILSESRFDFLKDLVKSLPDSSACDEDNSTATGGITSLSPMTPPAASASAVPLLPTAEDVKYPPSTHGLPPYLQHGVPNRDMIGDTESKSRLHPMMSPVSSGMCPPGGVGGSSYQVPVNPNFYMESSPAVHHHPSPYNRDRDGSDYHHNHFNSNAPSVIMTAPTQPQPLLVQPLKNERSSTPPVLVVDEDYDT